MICAVEARHRCRAAAELVGADPRVEAVDILDPSESPRNAWVVEIVIRAEAAPPGIIGALARHRLSLPDVSPQGPDHVVVTAEVDA